MFILQWISSAKSSRFQIRTGKKDETKATDLGVLWVEILVEVSGHICLLKERQNRIISKLEAQEYHSEGRQEEKGQEEHREVIIFSVLWRHENMIELE